MVSYINNKITTKQKTIVLILIVVDNGLVLDMCLGLINMPSLNPYCSGQWSRTHMTGNMNPLNFVVLILIVVDNGLVHVILKIR